ncbi:aspartate/glutamate racemase family protein [Flavobacterium sp. '19STA2R22 D10 B1']|uniref:aspartate/glutamate racemase family protein n=1 Tax=Flavobacterium aerium TaxID=3037261 RepID=UPI00278C5B5A|nr:amino acid racemase [Flavobacterium sp. '19STA2R22 D10 B1']
MPTKTLGIISGMGTRAGLLFVNKLIERINAPSDQDFPEFILHNNSKIPDRTLAIVYDEECPLIELKRSINKLQDCDVDFIVSTCVTSYFFINQLENSVKENIINPIELVFAAIKEKHSNYKKIGLLATTGTIKSKLFHEIFAKSSFELITLDDFEQEEKFMKSVYGKEGFKSSIISNESYALFEDAIDAFKMKGVDLIIGGCTEAQIGYDYITTDIPYIDVIDVLIDEVIYKMNLTALNHIS